MHHGWICDFVRDTAPISRRNFLRAGALGALAFAGFAPNRAAGLAQASVLFSLGVASGDPTSKSTVIWTRLALDPMSGGGMAPVPIEVEWLLATDPRVEHVVRRGTVLALPEDAHTVHVEVTGLAPDRWYWYRFKSGTEFSPIGRTRTFPEPGSSPRQLRFAFVSCQNWEAGYFNAWQMLAQEEIDFVVHLGDYIYEVEASMAGIRQHAPATETETLDDYRTRYAQYKSDPQLQSAHALFPFIMIWDDHEVEDNYAGAISAKNRDDNPDNDVPESDFRRRRAEAYKAYFEHLPLSPVRRPKTDNARIYHRIDWGLLAQFHLLDTRSFRTEQPCGGTRDRLPPAGDDLVAACGEELDPRASMTGADQEIWLIGGLQRSRARWNVIAQQVMMASVDFGSGVELVLPRLKGHQVRNVDAWDGYVSARNRLLGAIAEHQVANLVVLTGDTHSSWVADLKADFANLDSPVVGAEFVGPSISSNFPAGFIPIVHSSLQHPENSHIRYFDGMSHGYVRCVITPEQWRSDYRVVDSVLFPTGAGRTLKSFVVDSGRAGLRAPRATAQGAFGKSA
jgi:alkaline phosphatase D